MSEHGKKEKNQLDIFGRFKKIEGWEKAVFVAVVVAIVTGASAFTYQNVSLPKDNRRMDAIQQDVQVIKLYIANDAIDKALDKKDIQITKENVIYLKQEIKENFNEIKALLNQSYRLNKRIDENTK